MNAMELYDLVRDSKISLVEFMRRLDEREMEEERRLCYVAITRAMKKVYLTNAKSRVYFGAMQMNMPSRFIGEIPEELLDTLGLLRSGIVEKDNKTRGGFKGYGGKNYVSWGSSKAETEFLDDLDSTRSNFSWDD